MEKITSKSVEGHVLGEQVTQGVTEAAESKEMQRVTSKLEDAEIYVDEYREVLGDMFNAWEGKTMARPLGLTPGATYYYDYYDGETSKPEMGPSKFYRLDCQSGDVTVGHVDAYGKIEEYPFLALDKIAVNLVVPKFNWEVAFKKFLKVIKKKQKMEVLYKAICKTEPDYGIK